MYAIGVSLVLSSLAFISLTGFSGSLGKYAKLQSFTSLALKVGKGQEKEKRYEKEQKWSQILQHCPFNLDFSFVALSVQEAGFFPNQHSDWNHRQDIETLGF